MKTLVLRGSLLLDRQIQLTNAVCMWSRPCVGSMYIASMAGIQTRSGHEALKESAAAVCTA